VVEVEPISVLQTRFLLQYYMDQISGMLFLPKNWWQKIYFYKLCKDLITEKAHIKYCKYVLQVQRRAANPTVMAELRRYPILLEVFLNMITFWVRLTKENNSLLHNAFEESKTLHNKGIDCCYSCINSIFKPDYLISLKSTLKIFVMKKLMNYI